MVFLIKVKGLYYEYKFKYFNVLFIIICNMNKVYIYIGVLIYCIILNSYPFYTCSRLRT